MLPLEISDESGQLGNGGGDCRPIYRLKRDSGGDGEQDYVHLPILP